MYFKVTGKQAPILHVNEKPNQEEKTRGATQSGLCKCMHRKRNWGKKENLKCQVFILSKCSLLPANQNSRSVHISLLLFKKGKSLSKYTVFIIDFSDVKRDVTPVLLVTRKCYQIESIFTITKSETNRTYCSYPE